MEQQVFGKNGEPFNRLNVTPTIDGALPTAEWEKKGPFAHGKRPSIESDGTCCND